MTMVELRRRVAARLAPLQWNLPDTSSIALDLQQRAQASNIVLDVRDARLPLTSASKDLYHKIFSWKDHLIVLNKSDLADPRMMNKWKLYFYERHLNYIFVSAREKESVKNMVRMIKSLILRALKNERTTLVMLAGLPNVGKSLLTNTLHRVGRYNISALEKLTLAVTGSKPYITKSVRGYKINYTPPMFVLDTPSVMHSSICDVEEGMNLALTGAIEEEAVGSENLARYYLALWNGQALSKYELWSDEYRAFEFSRRPKDTHSPIEKRKLKSQSYKVEIRGILASARLDFDGSLEDDDDMLMLIEKQLKDVQDFLQETKVTEVTPLRAAKKLLSLYRDGKMGLFTLDHFPDVESASSGVCFHEPEINLPPEVETRKKRKYKRKRSMQNVSPEKLATIERKAEERRLRKLKPSGTGKFIY